jgi:hypothetical protein
MKKQKATMKKMFFLALTILSINWLTAQVATDTVPAPAIEEPNPYEVEPSKESKAYNAYRDETFEPPYGLKKVKAAIAKIKANDEGDAKVSNKVWDGFTLKEKFTYCMVHPESYSQNCDAMPPIADEHKKIFGFIPDAHMEADLSDRQIAFLKKNKDSVISWIKDLSTKKSRVYLNFKEAILQLNAKDMIPLLIDIYKIKRKDHDILTVLMLLMKEGKYQPFLKSTMYSKLYGNDAHWLAHLIANKANQDLIMERAMAYFKLKK